MVLTEDLIYFEQNVGHTESLSARRFGIEGWFLELRGL